MHGYRSAFIPGSTIRPGAAMLHKECSVIAASLVSRDFVAPNRGSHREDGAMIVGGAAKTPVGLCARGMTDATVIEQCDLAVCPTREPGRLRSTCLLPMVMLGGCSANSAPALILFGAYFPDWLVFAVLATLVAIATRILFGIAGKADTLPYALFTCLAVGVLVAGVVDLLWLDR